MDVNCRTSELVGEEFTRFHSSVKRGDIVGIVGFPGLYRLSLRTMKYYMVMSIKS